MIRRAAAAAILCLLALAPSARAADPTCQLDASPPPADPRIVPGTFEGVPYNVLLPADYATTTRRYPVLYLLHGRQYSEHSWLRKSDVKEFTKSFTGDRAAIVVTPGGGVEAYFFDYRDGSQDWGRFLLERLIPHIDRTFRTIPDGAHRAIGGFSAGGLSASYLGARHPDVFAAVASFSGVVWGTAPDEPYPGPGEVPVTAGTGSPGPARGANPRTYAAPKPSCGGGDATGAPAGNNRWFWYEHSAANLAHNLRGNGVYAGSGNGQPCGPEEANDPVLAAGTEPGLRTMAEAFDRALTAANVAHVHDPYPCGVHNMVGATRGLHAFWDVMVRAFGRREPASLDFRSTDPDIDVWGWTFRADPRRAPEFLEVRDAYEAGLTLIGTGTTTVVTKPLFAPGDEVDVAGARPDPAIADADGRVTLAVDLGPPSTTPQFSGGPAPAFVARRIAFAGPGAPPPIRSCAPGKRRINVKLRRLRKGERARSVAIAVNGRRVLVRRGRRAVRLRRVFVSLPSSTATVSVRIRTTKNRTLKTRRTYAGCE